MDALEYLVSVGGVARVGLLRANGFNAEAISGDVPQRKRLRMLLKAVCKNLSSQDLQPWTVPA